MFLDRLQAAIREYSLIDKGEKVLVGVSGGPDSIALLHGLHQLQEIGQWSLFAIHINHSLRGEESDEDAQYVIDFCKQHQIPYRVCRVDVHSEVKRQKGNVQATARHLRFTQFRNIAQELSCDKIALAHHVDDQVETLLMRLLRGTGVAGLAGMRWSHTWEGLTVIRPLLSTYRHQIERYCNEQGLQPRIDSSNESLYYTRNRVRKELVPALSTYNSHVKESLWQLSQLVQAEEEVWQTLIAETMDRHVKKQEENTYFIQIKQFLHLPVALQRRVVKLILSCLVKNGTSEVALETVEQVRMIIHHPHPSAQVNLPQNIIAVRQYDKCLITNERFDDPLSCHPVIQLQVPGVTKLPTFHGEIESTFCTMLPVGSEEKGNSWAVFDADALGELLFVRSRRPGDRIRCVGMKGRKRLKDLMMEAKIPAIERDRHPLVVTGDPEQILWIPDIRQSVLAPPSPNTRRYLYLIWRSMRT